MTPPVLATVERSGLATVQDAGRAHAAPIGVPRSGAWHRQRYRLAAALVCRDPAPTAPAIELLAGELVLRARAETAVAVVGPARILVGGSDAPDATTLAVAVDEDVIVRHEGPGPVYIAVAGWREPLVLGSAATDTFSGIGGRLLSPGAMLAGVGDTSEVGSFARQVPPPSGVLRVVPAAGLGGEGLRWEGCDGTVTLTARSGTRFEGVPPSVWGTGPSRPMVVGAIQVAPAGEGIILGPDGGLTGGYPVIGAVIAADLDGVSLLAPGDRIELVPVTIDAAVEAFDARDRVMQRCVVRPYVIG